MRIIITKQPPAEAGGFEPADWKSSYWPAGFAAGCSTSKLSLGSRSKWCAIYSWIISLVSSPAVIQKYPRAQKCLPQYRFFTRGNSSNILLDVLPLTRRIISEGAISGGAETRMWTWSLLTTPRRIWISNRSQTWRTSSRTLKARSPWRTWYRYFVTH